MKHFLIAIFLFVSTSLLSQSDLKIGEWKSYLPLHSADWVTQSDNYVYYSSENAIIIFDKLSLSSDVITKNEGLSEHKIRRIEYDSYNDQLIVGYENGNIDILKDGSILNIPFLRLNTQLNDKRVNHIYVADENHAYLSYSFGIIQLNLKSLEFGTTCFTNQIVNAIGSNNQFLFAATEDGVFTIPLNDERFGNFLQWSFLGENSGLFQIYDAQDIISFNNIVYINIDGVLYRQNGTLYQEYINQVSQDYRVESLSSSTEHLIISMKKSSSSSKVILVDASGTQSEVGQNCTNRILHAIEDQSGEIWFADEWQGLRFTKDGCPKYQLNGPNSTKVSEIIESQDIIYIASGGATEQFLYSDHSKDGFYMLENGIWTTYRNAITQAFKDNGFQRIQTLAKHPRQNILAVGSYYAGVLLFDMDNETFTFYDQDSSPLEGTQGDEARERVTSVRYDAQENLWITQYIVDKPLKVLTPDGLWYTFTLSGTNVPTSMTIDDFGNKWIASRQSGISVFNENGTLSDPSDDSRRNITTSSTELTSNRVNCITVDLNGEVWVGTDEGPVIFECGASVFDPSVCVGSRRKVLQDSIAAFLLETEDILAIEIDGANRKWFGTRNGIFVQSPDGETQIAHYTEENSPLFDNKIVSLRFVPESGEMFIGSDGGIQSLRTESSEGKKIFNESKVYAFPNPVRPEYTGPIAIKGLVRDANVKITDLTGKLVFETTALGGQAIWYKTDYTGREVATGVYLVFASSTDTFEDPKSFVTKILVVN